MPIAEKMEFMKSAEKRMQTVMTAESMNAALKIIADVLEQYEMQRRPGGEPEQDDMLQIYTDTMRIQGRSEKTVAHYAYIITRMMKSVGVSTRQITVYHLRNWLAQEKNRGVSDRTMEGYREVFSAYFNWLQREGLIERNPTANLGAIKCMKKVKKAYTAVDIEKLSSMCKCIRDRAIVEFLRTTGCRISEMTQLNRDSVNLREKKCTVLGKGNKERTVYLDSVACMMIGQYLETRKDEEEALFIGLRKERLRPDGVRTMLKVLAKKAGVEHVHPHKFRRTLATNLIRHGMPIQEVATILGHEKLDTTMRYVVQNNEDIQHDFRRYYA